MIIMNWIPIGLNWTILFKCLEMTIVVIWRYINKTELNWTIWICLPFFVFVLLLKVQGKTLFFKDSQLCTKNCGIWTLILLSVYFKKNKNSIKTLQLQRLKWKKHQIAITQGKKNSFIKTRFTYFTFSNTTT